MAGELVYSRRRMQAQTVAAFAAVGVVMLMEVAPATPQEAPFGDATCNVQLEVARRNLDEARTLRARLTNDYNDIKARSDACAAENADPEAQRKIHDQFDKMESWLGAAEGKRSRALVPDREN
jgi:hypothetical protein